jgi:hypothetical protein
MTELMVSVIYDRVSLSVVRVPVTGARRRLHRYAEEKIIDNFL